jgi:hypothetical protein
MNLRNPNLIVTVYRLVFCDLSLVWDRSACTCAETLRHRSKQNVYAFNVILNTHSLLHPTPSRWCNGLWNLAYHFEDPVIRKDSRVTNSRPKRTPHCFLDGKIDAFFPLFCSARNQHQPLVFNDAGDYFGSNRLCLVSNDTRVAVPSAPRWAETTRFVATNECSAICMLFGLQSTDHCLPQASRWCGVLHALQHDHCLR